LVLAVLYLTLFRLGTVGQILLLVFLLPQLAAAAVAE
jgi:hypothetical protein